jgi:hypothetical protein
MNTLHRFAKSTVLLLGLAVSLVIIKVAITLIRHYGVN